MPGDGVQAFILYPAIDVHDGQCVRLLQGDYESSTVYGKSPREMAERWLQAGANFLHVVDLDAAKSGAAVNRQAILGVLQAAGEVGARVQVGGGIRDERALAAWLEAGATRCIIGTAALDTAWVERMVRIYGGESLVVGLDGRDGQLAVKGWVEQTDVPLVEVARRLAAVGVRHALVTDVRRDGTLQGANLELAAGIQAESGLACIASGGIRDVSDVLAAQNAGLAGAIAGRSLYDGTLNLQTALAELRTCTQRGNGRC
ncbi:1-(5-phosphoribosyl)-5-[(5-phosphoribosylamino)methylideneamino]imidazole-4-carboxamide isomerase [Alicyclobacillus herbarius]|uniref:1-(5-phosphoribosyl)-5-[(5- phosphoribosylamino)methylideneamino]imidazole-4- carboxamide isomerase n=1 Tax=Alicyclobacillus herbarius TaxID=122960 RepID=UPI00040DC67E|nr:1-(5-phosphoribosyl)-5-[(5-phosphoribosylamino)methylideneamino]imidazole-4-carboxamide isomerase [Alicyclobacillus herbarius]